MTEQDPRTSAFGLLSRLNAEFERYHDLVTVLPMDKLKLQEDSRRYLCLRCAGFLEQLVYLTVNTYLGKTSGGPALEFSQSFFEQAPNLTPRALEQLFGRFGQRDTLVLSDFLEKPRRDVLADLMAIRNQIAHGETIGGAKLDPTRYVEFCNEFYRWTLAEYLS